MYVVYRYMGTVCEDNLFLNELIVQQSLLILVLKGCYQIFFEWLFFFKKESFLCCLMNYLFQNTVHNGHIKSEIMHFRSKN